MEDRALRSLAALHRAFEKSEQATADLGTVNALVGQSAQVALALRNLENARDMILKEMEDLYRKHVGGTTLVPARGFIGR